MGKKGLKSESVFCINNQKELFIGIDLLLEIQ